MTFWRGLILLSLLGLMYYVFQERPEIAGIRKQFDRLLSFGAVHYRPGVLVPHAPVQRAVTLPSFQRGKYTYYPVATFVLRGRVLAKERYWFDREASIAPYDLVLGWGPLSDETVIEKTSFRQGLRHYSYDYDIKGMPVRLIGRHTANIHMVPSQPHQETMLGEVNKGDIIEAAGYLVVIKAEDSWVWRTSVTRDDLGEGSGEILYLERLAIVSDNYPRVE